MFHRCEEGTRPGRCLPSTRFCTDKPASFRYSSLQSDHALDLKIIPPAVLRDWETRLASHKKPFQDDGPSQSAVAQLQDLDLADEDGVLQPVLTNASLSDDIPARPVLLENPTPDSLTTLVGQDIPLNTKQVLVVRKLLTEIMMWADRPYDLSRRKQLLLCITGEGGTGKTQILEPSKPLWVFLVGNKRSSSPPPQVPQQTI